MGDIALIRKAAWTLLAGILLSLAISAILGALWPSAPPTYQLLIGTRVGVDSVARGLASSAAAALSLATGLSSVLVGVMVAVALLPPAATLGLTLGQRRIEFAMGAGLPLVVNIARPNLANNVTLFVKKIRPRAWLGKIKQAGTCWCGCPAG